MDNFTLPLLKFSHAIDSPAEVNKYSWIHVTHNLVAVFEASPTGAPHRTLKVIQGTRVLEHVDLHQKAAEAAGKLERARLDGVQLRHEQLAIYGMFRSPLLAISYSAMEINQKRRLQLKFTSEGDFHKALDFVISSGCQVKPSIPPGASNQRNLGEATVRHAQLVEPLAARPSTAASSVTLPMEQETRTTHAQLYTTPQLAPSARPESRNFQMDGNHAQPNPPQMMPAAQVSFHDRPETASQGQYPTYAFQRSFSTPSANDMTGFTYRADARNSLSDTVPSNDNLSHRHGQYSASSHFPSLAEDGARPHTGTPPQLAFHFNDKPLPQIPDATPLSAQQASPGSSSSIVYRRPIGNLQTPQPMDGFSLTPRARAAVVSDTENVAFNQALPPRRTLPWSRPNSRAEPTSSTPKLASDQNHSSRPSTSTLDLPPLPTPKLAREKISSRRSLPSSSAERTASARPRASLAEITNNASFPSLMRAPSKVQQSLTVDEDTDNLHVSMPSSLATLHASSPKKSAGNIKGNGSNSMDAVDPTGATALNKVLDQIAIGMQPPLTAYAAQPVEQRRVIVSNWIVQHIEDDAFLALCEDVYGTWQRVGLGLE